MEQARYNAARAERRYQAVDPDNRLVARGLETASGRPGSPSSCSWTAAAGYVRQLRYECRSGSLDKSRWSTTIASAVGMIPRPASRSSI